MIGNAVAPCPKCGGVGRIPDGRYTDTGAELFSRSDLNRVLSAIEELRQRAESGATSEEIKKEISEKYPFLKHLTPLIPKTPSDVVAYLLALSALLGHFAKQPAASIPPSVHVQVEVQQVIEQVSVDQKTNQPNSQPTPSNKEDQQTEED